MAPRRTRGAATVANLTFNHTGHREELRRGGSHGCTGARCSVDPGDCCPLHSCRPQRSPALEPQPRPGPEKVPLPGDICVHLPGVIDISTDSSLELINILFHIKSNKSDVISNALKNPKQQVRKGKRIVTYRGVFKVIRKSQITLNVFN